MKKIVNIGIIGLGYWGPNFARLCFETDNVVLKYCCDVNKTALEKVKTKYPGVLISDSYQTVLKDPEIDAVIVVTPPQSHYKICREFLLRGKDVLVEKPLTVNEKQAADLVSISKNKKRILMVDHIFKYNNAILKLREYITSKYLGKVFYISASYTALGPVRSDVNAILDLAPHYFYTINFILNSKPRWISAWGQSYLKDNNSDVAFITIGYPNNILAKVDVSWLFPFKERNLVVVGENRMASFDDTSPDEKLKIYDKSAFFDTKNSDYPAILKIMYREGDIVTPHVEPKEALKEVVLHFRNCVLSRENPKSDAEDGKMNVRMLQAAVKSMKNRGKRVFFT